MIMNTCINDDCLNWMRGVSDPFADLIMADPPFNIGFEYDSYCDSRDTDDYLWWCREWITQCIKLLKPDGNMLICMGDEHVSDIDCLCKSLGLVRNNWIIWQYSFGVSGTLNTRKRFTRSKTHILRFARKPTAYFNAIAVAEPSDRLTKYHDKRADPRGKCPNDVFVYNRISGTHKSRVRGIPTQMPIALIKTWIKAMCPPNGIVFDPFAGSGATLLAAKELGFNYLGIEISCNYHKIILDRLA